jgi:hypothetical protein
MWLQMMRRSLAPRLALSLAFLLIAARLFWLILQESYRGSEVALYYVAFFWALASVRKDFFNTGALVSGPKLPITLALCYFFVLIVSYMTAREVASNVIKFDRTSSFFAIFSFGYFLLFLAALFGTQSIRIHANLAAKSTIRKKRKSS